MCLGDKVIKPNKYGLMSWQLEDDSKPQNAPKSSASRKQHEIEGLWYAVERTPYRPSLTFLDELVKRSRDLASLRAPRARNM